MYEDLLRKLDDSYVIKALEEMISIPSVVKEEKDLAEYLREKLDGLGLETELHEVEPGRPNVYARLRESRRGRG